MSSTPVYIGYSLHWGMHEMKEGLARKIITSVILKPPGRNGLLGKPSANRDKLNKDIQAVFREIGQNKQYETSLLMPIIDDVIDVERIFFHLIASTGCEAVSYHGDPHGPNSVNLSGKSDLFSEDKFVSVEAQLLDKARAEVGDMLPEVSEKCRSDSLPWDDHKELLFLVFALIDILVAMRINARIILFNPFRHFEAGQKILSAKTLGDISSFYRIFERQSGAIITPAADYDLIGLKPDELIGSSSFIEYCRAHDQLNILGHRMSAFDSLTHMVSDLSDRYKRLVETNTMAFALTKGISKLAELATSGVSNAVKEIAEVLIRLCKDRDRNIVLYSGNNLETYCSDLIKHRLFVGKEPGVSASRRERLCDRLSDLKRTLGIRDA